MINKVMLIGRVGSEPEIKVTKKMKSLQVIFGYNKRYKVGQTNQEETQWHMIKVFDPRLAETIEKYVPKVLCCMLRARLSIQSMLILRAIKRLQEILVQSLVV